MRIHRTESSRATAPLSLVLLALLAGGSTACRTTEEDDGQHVVWLVRHGRYADARTEARSLAESQPENEELQRLWVDAEVAYLLDRGRVQVFSGQATDGLAFFHRAAQVDPGNAVVDDWILKTRVQLAEEALDEATALGTGGDLVRLAELYEEVLAQLPEEDDSERVQRLGIQARLGLSRVLLTQNYRDGQSRSYYVGALEDFREYFLHPAHRGFDIALKFDEEHVKAEERRREVELVLADERLAKAQSFEEQGLFHAAMKEYRLVLLIDSSNAVARDGFDRMDLKTRQLRTLAEADMSVRRGALERAGELLDEAGKLAVEESTDVSRLEAEIEDERLRRMYERARAFEQDYRYVEAVEAYALLLDEVEHYDDAITRKATLEEFVLLADESYTAALDAKTDEDAAAALRSIQVFWPEYRDVEQRLAEIEARLAPSAAGGAVDPEGSGD